MLPIFSVAWILKKETVAVFLLPPRSGFYRQSEMIKS